MGNNKFGLAALTALPRFGSIGGNTKVARKGKRTRVRAGFSMYLIRFTLLCIDMVNDFLSKNCPYVAGAIAFYMLFSMFPLILATISIWGFFLGPDADQVELAEQVAEVIPISSGFVAQTVSGVASAKIITGIVSVLGLMWASSAAFGAIRKGINIAWGIQKTRPFIKERLIDMALAAAAGILMVMLLFVAPTASSIHKALVVVFPDISFEFLSRVISQAVSPILSFSTFMVLYRYMPNTEVRLSDVWLGAVFSCLAFEGAKWGFLQYVNTYSVHNVLYGSVGAVMALLGWVYISAIVLLFGALLTSRYARITKGVSFGVRGHRLMWTGLTRVRLRVVAEGETEA